MGIIPITPSDDDRKPDVLPLAPQADALGGQAPYSASDDPLADEPAAASGDASEAPELQSQPPTVSQEPVPAPPRIEIPTVDAKLEQALAMELAAAASGGQPGPAPRVEVTPVGDPTKGMPEQLRLVVDFRGLVRQASAKDGSPESPTESGSADHGGAKRDATGASPTEDPRAPPPTLSAADEPASTSPGPAGASDPRSAGTQQEPRWMGEFLSSPGVDSSAMPGLPLMLSVSLAQPESLIGRAIRLAAPEFRKMFEEISDQKLDDFMYFLETEERRINGDQ
jgi:hypothetical protein